MAEKIINTRFEQLYNTQAEWTRVDPILRKGEIGFIELDLGNNITSDTAPHVLFKVGDDVHKFSELNYCYAKASDVYSWAKKSESDFITWAQTNVVTKAFVTSLLTDYSTTNQMNSAIATAKQEAIDAAAADAKSKADAALADAKSYTDQEVTKAVSGGVEGLASEDYVDEAVKGVQDQIDALDDTYATDTQLADAIRVEKERAEGVESGLDGRLTTAEGKITTLIGDDTDKSVRAIANEELAAQLIPDAAKESLDTLGEIAAWIQSHPDDASAMNQAITALQNQLNGIDAGTGTVKKYVDDAITALKIGDYALAADLTALAERVTALEGKVDVDKVSTAIATAKQEAINDADGKLNAYKESNDAAVEAAQKAGDDAAAAVEALDSELAAIAKTGNINDLVQTSGDVLILSCNAAVFGTTAE